MGMVGRVSASAVNRIWLAGVPICEEYRGADKSVARPTSRCILFDGENISFDASLVIQGVSRF